MDAVKIITPGSYTTVQDRGRYGFQNMGIPVSGALDRFSFEVANLLVGNPDNSPALELTVMGISFEVLKEMDIALTGAGMVMDVNKQPKRQWRSVRVAPGDIVTIGLVTEGCRGYLAFGGGLDLPSVMGSCATYVAGSIGGVAGRPLKAGDILRVRGVGCLEESRILPDSDQPRYRQELIVRAVPGPQDHYFDTGLDTFFSTDYVLTPEANRMGCRLAGEKIEPKPGMPGSILSEPCVPGSVQVPPNGQPIILLNEQTVGGYAKIATIISSDLWMVAQAKPGDTVRFEKIGVDMARELALKNAARMNRLRRMFPPNA